MVIKVYISGISASKEIKKRQQRALMILDSLKVRYDTIDLSESGHEMEKEQMRNVCKKRGMASQAFPPQFFNEEQYCGDYEDFELASDDDTVLSFLKVEEDIAIENGELSSPDGNAIDIENDITDNHIEINETEINENGETIINEIISETVEVTETTVINTDGPIPEDIQNMIDSIKNSNKINDNNDEDVKKDDDNDKDNDEDMEQEDHNEKTDDKPNDNDSGDDVSSEESEE